MRFHFISAVAWSMMRGWCNDFFEHEGKICQSGMPWFTLVSRIGHAACQLERSLRRTLFCGWFEPFQQCLTLCTVGPRSVFSIVIFQRTGPRFSPKRRAFLMQYRLFALVQDQRLEIARALCPQPQSYGLDLLSILYLLKPMTLSRIRLVQIRVLFFPSFAFWLGLLGPCLISIGAVAEISAVSLLILSEQDPETWDVFQSATSM